MNELKSMLPQLIPMLFAVLIISSLFTFFYERSYKKKSSPNDFLVIKTTSFWGIVGSALLIFLLLWVKK